jgi:protein-disulfide isomerase
MSRKSQRNRPSAEAQSAAASEAAAARGSYRSIIVGIVIAVLVIVAASFLFSSKSTEPSASDDGKRAAALANPDAPTVGDPGARLHIVEFLDPACETCAAFYPLVKQLVAQNPGRIRLSLRHVALHEGSDYVVRMLEASRKQDKYWQTLEALFATQPQWAVHHTVQPDLALRAVANVGLDLGQLVTDMNSPDVVARLQRDRDDAMALRVTATPEYFVNGRPLPSFGEQQLRALVDEELRKAY